MPSANTTFGSLPGNSHYSYFCSSVELWLLAQAQTTARTASHSFQFLPLLVPSYSEMPLHPSWTPQCIGSSRGQPCASSSLSSGGDSEVVWMFVTLGWQHC